MASNELLWRTNQYCGDDPTRHVKITHLVSQLASDRPADRRRENARVLLADLVATSAAVAATRSRLAKIAALADCLRRPSRGRSRSCVS